eukprot:COSAG03_NODE_1669_length_3685_cov_3.006414_1_plen_61_part_00
MPRCRCAISTPARHVESLRAGEARHHARAARLECEDGVADAGLALLERCEPHTHRTSARR